MAADAPPLSAEELAGAIALIENDLCASADMLDAAASEAYAVVLAAAKRALAEARKPASDDGDVPMSLYSRALDEIYALRALLAYEAVAAAVSLGFKRFPKSRRESVLGSIERMRTAARGKVHAATADRASWALKSALESAGASQCLTRSQWEAEQPERGAAPAGAGLFYIQDTRAIVGNSALWWRPNREGYTCDLAQAGRFTADEAHNQERVRGTDRAVPCELADSLAQLHVHVDTLSDRLTTAPAGRDAAAEEAL